MADFLSMSNPRLAMIGCGRIAEFHAPAFRAAGFELAAVCSSPGSPRPGAFASKHGIPFVFDTVDDLLSSRQRWDALLIAVSVEATLDVLKLVLESGAPILVEKPVCLRSADLLPYIDRGSLVIVGYNRRFYGTAHEARRVAQEGAPLLAQLVIPESIRTPARAVDDPLYLRPFFANSVHGLDLARYVFGHLDVAHVQRLINHSGAISGVAATLKAENDSIVQLTANWGAPANFSLTLDRPGQRLDLRPFELATAFGGLEIQEPTAERPIRIYTPKEVQRFALSEVDRRFKPGFVRQAEALRALARGEHPGPAARLEDAFAVLQMAEQLVGRQYP